MANRIIIGDHGGMFKFRVSAPGYDVLTTSLDNMRFYESMNALVPYTQGTVTLGAGSNTTVGFAETYTEAPFVVLRNNLNLLPGPFSCWARFNIDQNTLRIYNDHQSATMIIKYAVFRQIADIIIDETG